MSGKSKQIKNKQKQTKTFCTHEITFSEIDTLNLIRYYEMRSDRVIYRWALQLPLKMMSFQKRWNVEFLYNNLSIPWFWYSFRLPGSCKNPILPRRHRRWLILTYVLCEKEMVSNFSVFVWKAPWTVELVGHTLSKRVWRFIDQVTRTTRILNISSSIIWSTYFLQHKANFLYFSSNQVFFLCLIETPVFRNTVLILKVFYINARQPW